MRAGQWFLRCAAVISLLGLARAEDPRLGNDEISDLMAINRVFDAALASIGSNPDKGQQDKGVSAGQVAGLIRALGGKVDFCDLDLAKLQPSDGFDPTKWSEGKKAFCAVRELRKVVEDELANRRRTATSATFGVTTEKAPSRGTKASASRPTDKTQIQWAIEVQAGNYPSRLKAKWSASDLSEDGTNREDISTLRINWDYYFRPEIEGYAFVERFQDSYLSIDRRYEIGAGAEYEKQPWSGRDATVLCKSANGASKLGLTTMGRKKLAVWKKLVEAGVTKCEDGVLLDDQLKSKLEFLAIPGETVAELVKATVENMKTFRSSDLIAGIYKADALFEWGIGLAAFREAQRGSFKTAILDDAGDVVEDAQFTVAEDRSVTRASLRPSFRIRGSSGLEARVMVYYKPSLGGRARTGERDYRIDGNATVKFNFAKTFFNAEPAVEITYDYRRLNVPIGRNEQPTTGLAAGQTLQFLEARRVHQTVRLSFTAKW